jgi:hypothetical protein
MAADDDEDEDYDDSHVRPKRSRGSQAPKNKVRLQ